MASHSRRSKWIALAILVIVVGAVAYVIWDGLLREEPLHYESELEHFKYGSIGTEQEGLRVPYWIWLVLPRIFPEYLPGPGGYVSLRFAWEEGRELPIGLTKKVIGQPLVGINCAICHTATVRESRFDKPTIFTAAPAHQIDMQGYFRFLFNSASDILNAIAPIYNLSLVDRLLYRYILIPQTRKGLLQFKEELAWMDSRPDWGRGRIAPFNPAKFRYLEIPQDDTIGNSDNVSVWNMKARLDIDSVYHWDGLLKGPLQEVVLSSALGDSVTPKTLPLEDLTRIETWLLSAPVPEYPYKVDSELAQKGAPVFDQECASCHAFGGEKTGSVIAIDEVGTDRHRLDMWTQEASDAYNAYGDEYDWDFSNFQKTNGYASVPLDRIWLRGPYLHNGSVPSLTDLLEPVENRPKLFYRGYDVYDKERVGFVSSGEDAERFGFRYDVVVPGNGNQGHEYGTGLDPELKKALVEYLKTL